MVAVYNALGTKLISYKYDAWGNFTTTYHNGGASTSARYNPFRYRGYYYDDSTGLYYLHTRYYDPSIGRFISADIYINANGGLQGYNMYAYCNNNPVMGIDPTGEFLLSTIIIGAVIGLVVGATTSAVTQGMTNGWENIDVTQVVFDGLLGAVSGAVGASGIGAIGSMVLGGTLNFVGSVGGDLIANDGDWDKINWGKASTMGLVGIGLGAWAGAGAQNTQAMCKAINSGKSWGAKMFTSFIGGVSNQSLSQLARQTSALYMNNAILGYKMKALFSAAASIVVSSVASIFLNNLN